MEHLGKLEAATIITSEEQGWTWICQLSPGAFGPAKDWLREQRAIWDRRPDRFDDHIKTLMQARKP